MAGWSEPVECFDPFGASAEAMRYLVLDVFTETPLQGNQLAVFTDGRGLRAGQMQAIAAELKLSETVFLLPPEQGGDARARIFTPATELPFAGHPLLGTAIVLGAATGREEVVVETAAGPVPVSLGPGSGLVRNGEMSQPVPSWKPFSAREKLLAALGVVSTVLPVIAYTNGPRHVMVGLADEATLAALAPDMSALARVLGEAGVSCFAGRDGHFKTRVFAPGLGVDEDPATGSAAGPLAVHCVRHGLTAFAAQIEIRQGEEIGRASLLRARVEGSSERIASVHVGGSAVIVARAEMVLA